MPVCVCRIFTSVCWRRVFLAALKLQSVLTNVTYFNFETNLTQILQIISNINARDNTSNWLRQSYKSGRAFRVGLGFGPGSGQVRA